MNHRRYLQTQFQKMLLGNETMCFRKEKHDFTVTCSVPKNIKETNIRLYRAYIFQQRLKP